MMRKVEKKFMTVIKKNHKYQKNRYPVKKRFFLRRKIGKVIVAETDIGVSCKFPFSKFPAKIF